MVIGLGHTVLCKVLGGYEVLRDHGCSTGRKATKPLGSFYSPSLGNAAVDLRLDSRLGIISCHYVAMKNTFEHDVTGRSGIVDFKFLVSQNGCKMDAMHVST